MSCTHAIHVSITFIPHLPVFVHDGLEHPVSHSVPVYPGGHIQANPLQIPLFLHMHAIKIKINCSHKYNHTTMHRMLHIKSVCLPLNTIYT